MNDVPDRRTNIIARLEEQKLLLNDPSYTRTVCAPGKEGRSTHKARVKLCVIEV
jgi:hypothetical protein